MYLPASTSVFTIVITATSAWADIFGTISGVVGGLAGFAVYVMIQVEIFQTNQRKRRAMAGGGSKKSKRAKVQAIKEVRPSDVFDDLDMAAKQGEGKMRSRGGGRNKGGTHPSG